MLLDLELKPDPVQLLGLVSRQKLVFTLGLVLSCQRGYQLIFETEKLRVLCLENLLERDVSKSRRRRIVDISQSSWFVFVKVEYHKVFLLHVVHHLYLAKTIPNLLPYCYEERLRWLQSSNHLRWQIGNQTVVPLEWRKQHNQCLHQNGHIRNVFLDEYDLLLQQKCSN